MLRHSYRQSASPDCTASHLTRTVSESNGLSIIRVSGPSGATFGFKN
jgi:hypothetical protein